MKTARARVFGIALFGDPVLLLTEIPVTLPVTITIAMKKTSITWQH